MNSDSLFKGFTATRSSTTRNLFLSPSTYTCCQSLPNLLVNGYVIYPIIRTSVGEFHSGMRCPCQTAQWTSGPQAFSAVDSVLATISKVAQVRLSCWWGKPCLSRFRKPIHRQAAISRQTSYLYLPMTCSLNLLFHSTPMLYFCMELKWQCIGRTMSNPYLVLFISIGIDTMASYVGSSLSIKS